MPKVALAYSGGLDTAICVHYFRHVRGMRVVTFSANVGQPEYLEPLAEQAVELGAAVAHLADLREKFAREYLFPCIRADAVYEGGNFLFSALSRPLIVQHLVQVAEEEGCEFVAHGARGTGNDLQRIEACVAALAPSLEILTPLAELGLRSPQDDIEYAQRNGIRFESERKTLYNMEQNLWGSSLHLRGLEDTWAEPPRDTYVLTTPPSEAPVRPTVIEIDFVRGDPVAVDGQELSPVRLVDHLNKVGGRNAVGRFDIVEDRISGLKCRVIYESPAAAILLEAHRALEAITLDRETLRLREPLALRYAGLVYEGKWFHAAREGLEAFFSRINANVTGTVRIQLCRGLLAVTGRKSPQSLFLPADGPPVRFPVSAKTSP